MKKNIFKIIIIDLIFIAILLSFFTFKRNESLKANKNIGLKTQELTNSQIDTKSKLYIQIEDALLKGERIIDLDILSILKSPKELFNLLEEVTNNNPEIMYYKGATYTLGKLKIDYSKNKNEINSHQDQTRLIKDNFLSIYKDSDLSDYEKILAVHDYVVSSSNYDTRESIGQILPPEAYSIYGTLVLGQSVCEGYAKSMKYFLDGLGIESYFVIGESKGESHAWNLVKIEDQYYHIDPTWDDPVTEDGKDILRYNYFNLTDDELSKTHSWIRENYPEAKGTKYNYFVYNNLLVSNKEEFTKIIEKALLNKRPSITVKYEGVNKLDINSLVEGIVIKNKGLIRIREYSYSIDDIHGIINLDFKN